MCSTCMCIHRHTSRAHQCGICGSVSWLQMAVVMHLCYFCYHGFCHYAIGLTPIMFLQKWILVQWSCIICISLQQAEQDIQQPPKGRKNVIQTVWKECLCLKLCIYLYIESTDVKRSLALEKKIDKQENWLGTKYRWNALVTFSKLFYHACFLDTGHTLQFNNQSVNINLKGSCNRFFFNLNFH